MRFRKRDPDPESPLIGYGFSEIPDSAPTEEELRRRGISIRVPARSAITATTRLKWNGYGSSSGGWRSSVRNDAPRLGLTTSGLSAISGGRPTGRDQTTTQHEHEDGCRHGAAR